MDTLLLIDPGLSEILQRSSLIMPVSTEWNGTWQNARINHGDAAAWGLVSFFLITLGLVAGCVAASLIRPRGPRREHLLIDEVLRNEDQLAESVPGAAEGRDPWEKPADWWKGKGG
jgi:hypothetical protein